MSRAALALVIAVTLPGVARADCTTTPQLCGLPVTSTIEQPDYDDAIDVVLVGDGFTTAASWATAAASAIATFKGQPLSGLYGTVPNLYNFHVVEVLSSTTDVADTDPTDTALGMRAGGSFIAADDSRVATAALNAPDVDVVIAIANGSGRANAYYPSQLAAGSSVRLGNSASPISHELGHALIHLADEYVEASLCTSTSEASVVSERNVTADPTCTRFSTTPDAGCVQGAKYCASGMYRSASACLMATSGNVATCPVCRRSVRELLLEKLTGIDHAEPWGVPITPAAGATVAGTVRLSAVLYDDTFSPTMVSFVIDGVFRGRVVTTGTSAQLDFDTTQLADGAHTFAVFPDDAAGHAGRSTTVTFQTQNFTAATAAVLAVQNPADGATVSGKVFVSGAVTSGPTPAWVALTVDGVAVALVAEGRAVSFAWDVTPGPHALQVLATDHAQARLGSPIVHVTGALPPADGGGGGGTIGEQGLHAFISAPTAWTAVGASFLFDYSIFGATAAVTDELWLDGVRVTPNPLAAAFATTPGQKRALIDASGWTLGPHQLELRATSGGSSASAVVPVVRVAAASNPTALLVSPAPYVVVRGQLNASLRGLDDVGVSSLALFVDGAQVGSAAGASATIAWDTTLGPDGNRQLVARATDGAGNQGSSAPVLVQVDNTAPQVAITSPRANDTVPVGLGAVVFTSTEQGSGVAELALYVDGQRVLTATSGASFPVTLTAGGHDLAVEVTDRAGNVTRSAPVHVTAANCTTASCNDGDACTTDACGTSGACLHVPTANCCASAADCDDGDTCTTDACSNGACTHGAVAGCCNFGAGCSDGQLCTLDVCSAVGGTCSHAPAGCCATATDCDDGNTCTADSCLAAGWCAHDWNGQCCRAATDCDDRNPCTTDACNAGACTHAPTAGCCNASSDCDDGVACTLNQCVNHTCTFPTSPGCCSTAADCATLNPCQTVACTAGRCVSTPTASGCCTFGFECDDRDACTVDACQGGTCAHRNTCCTQSSQCDDQRACTTDGCNLDAGQCVFAPVAGCCTADGDCDDLDVCTTDTCLNGSCAHPAVAGCCHAPADCDDADACTTDGCSASHACTHQNTCCTTAGDCDDANACTSESCDAGACVSTTIAGCCATAADCDDLQPCTVDTCEGGACAHRNTCCGSAGDCDDGDACTTDGCDAGACESVAVADCCHAAVDCDDHDACTDDRCVGTACQHTTTCCATAADCVDDDPCTVDACDGGQCANAPLVCAEGEACHDGRCATPTTGEAPVSGSCGCGDASVGPLLVLAAWLARRRRLQHSATHEP